MQESMGYYLVWRYHLLGAQQEKSMEEYICFWENLDLTAKQGGTSNQQLQNSYFWAVFVLGLPNAKGQLLGMLVKANNQNRRAEPGKELSHASARLMNRYKHLWEKKD